MLKKRIFDLFLSGPILIILICIFPIVAFAIKLDSRGPILFWQTRVGRFEKSFLICKFRTMVDNVGDAPSHLVGSSNITFSGRWLRKTKIDELPQVINVLRGEMSFVGPRPCLPGQIDLIEARRAAGIFDVKPGVTGLAQVQGFDMSNTNALTEVDKIYVENQCLVNDLRILFSTLKGNGSGDAAV